MNFKKWTRFIPIFSLIYLGSIVPSSADSIKSVPISEKDVFGWYAVITTDELTGSKSAVFTNLGTSPNQFTIFLPMCTTELGKQKRIEQAYFIAKDKVVTSGRILLTGQRNATIKIRIDSGNIEEFKAIFNGSEDIQQIIPIGEEDETVEAVTTSLYKLLSSGREATVRIEIDSGEPFPIELNNKLVVESTKLALELARCALD